MFVFAQWQISGMFVVANVHPMAGFLFGFSAANDHLSHGGGYDVQIHSSSRIIPDDLASVQTGNPRGHFPTVATSVEVFLSGCAGSDVSILTVVSMKLQVGVADCLTASTLVSGTPGREGVPSERLDNWLEVNREGLPHNRDILFCWGIPTAVGVFSCPLVGESNTQPNIVVGGG